MRDSGEREKGTWVVELSSHALRFRRFCRAQSRAFVVWKELEKSPTTGLGFRFLGTCLTLSYNKAI